MTGNPQIPQPAEISAEWMQQALKASGAAPTIEALEVEALTGATHAMGSLFRCRLIGRDGDPADPASVVVKLPGPAGLAFAWFAKWFSVHRREYAFYRHLAPRARVSAPTCFHADFDERGNRLVLVMEDLAKMETVPQDVGVGPERALAAIEEIARFHGQFRKDVEVGAVNPADCQEFLSARERRILQTIYMLALPVALRRVGAEISPAARRLLIGFGRRVDAHFANVAKDSPTVVHGDYRAENLMFGTERADDLAVIDWQGWGLGCGMWDVAYFLGGSVSTEHRRRIERRAVEAYHGIVCGFGMKNYTLDDCWRSYRQNMLGPLLFYAMGCGVVSSDDADRLNVTKISLLRVLAAIEDLDSGEFMPDRESFPSSVGAFSALSGLVYRVVSLGEWLRARAMAISGK